MSFRLVSFTTYLIVSDVLWIQPKQGVKLQDLLVESVGRVANQMVQSNALKLWAAGTGGLHLARRHSVTRHWESQVLHMLLIHTYHAGGSAAKALEVHWQNKV